MSFELIVADTLGVSTVDGRWSLERSGSTKTLLISVAAEERNALIEMLNQFAEDDLPIPLVSIGPSHGFTLWVVQKNPISTTEAIELVDGLRNRYLSLLRQESVMLHTGQVDCVPQSVDGQRWSAFIDPTMISMFMDEPWLAFPPNLDQQAQLVSRVQPVAGDALRRVLFKDKTGFVEIASTSDKSPQEQISPKDFLLGVMNNASLPMADRIAAASALLNHSK